MSYGSDANMQIGMMVVYYAVWYSHKNGKRVLMLAKTIFLNEESDPKSEGSPFYVVGLLVQMK